MNSKQRFFLFLFLLAFFLNGIIPFFATYNWSTVSLSKAQFSSFAGKKILLCTAEGFKWISWNDLNNAKKPITPHPKFQCPLCYLAAHNLKHLTPAFSIATSFPILISSLLTYSLVPERGGKYRLTPSYLSRAPPFSIIT